MCQNWRFVNPLPVLFALVVTASLLPTAMAQFIQQGDKLVGTGAFGYAGQGASVAVSADGNTALVGGPNDNGIGAAWVYTRSNGVWTQQGGKLVGTAAVPPSVVQGASVALSADGNTAIVGGGGDNGLVGAAWVYTRSGGVWRQQGSKLVGAGAVGTAVQGRSVALSADGNTAIVGGPYDDGKSGAVWVYTRSGGVWRQQGGKLTGAGGVGNPYQGDAVALSADGNTAIVGGPGDSNNGALWVYTRSGGVWSQQGGKLVAEGAEGLAFGRAVALSADGNTALVGGPVDYGAVWVFTRSDGVWSQQGGKLSATDVFPYANQGASLALTADGNMAAVGAPGGGAFGATWIYTRSGSLWSQQGGRLLVTGAAGAGPTSQGAAVALSRDGSTLLVGGPADGGGFGAVWPFVLPAGPSIASAGVVNGASFLPGIAPGAWITIQGANLSPTTRSWTSTDFSGNNLPAQLDGVSVTVNGKQAYPYYVSPTQLNVLAPDDAARGSVPVQVTTPLGASNIATATAADFSPALFTFKATQGTYAAAVRADGAYLGPATPARPGDIILLFGTGFGPTAPATPIGQLVDPAPLANQVKVSIGGSPVIGGVPATVLFAGIVSPGLYQFNVVVPDVMNGDNLVWIQVGDKTSQPQVFLRIQP